MSTITEHTEHLRNLLQVAGVTATTDPAAADTNRPCVLIAPPTLDYTQRLATHRVIALSSHAGGTLAAVEQLGELVDLVAAHLDVEAAEPISYALTPATGTVPAYLIRVTTSH